MTTSNDFTGQANGHDKTHAERGRAAAGRRGRARYNPGMYRIAVIALLGIFLGLQYRLWIADGGWAQVQRLNDERAALRDENEQHRKRNDAMQAEVDDLKSGESATEGRARADMGMIKRDERFFLTVAQPASATAPVADN